MAASPNSAIAFLMVYMLAVSNGEVIDVASKFINAKIVPGVIPQAPTVLAKVSYPSGKFPELGTRVSAGDIKDAPTVTFTRNSNAKYVMLMIDINPMNSSNQTQHWLVSDIQQTEPNNTLTEYLGNLSCHKKTRQFVVLLYKQNENEIKENHLDASNIAERINFNVNDFVKKYALGDPVAGNFFEVNSGAVFKGSIAALIAVMGALFMNSSL